MAYYLFIVDNCINIFEYTFPLDTYYFRRGVNCLLIMTVVFEDGILDIIDDLNNMKKYYKDKGITIGISESISIGTHFIKIFCEDEIFNEKFRKSFNIYLSNAIYKVVINEFINKDMMEFLSDTYFFLRDDELAEIIEHCKKALISEGKIIDETMVYCLNRKNNVLEKITQCVEDNSEININGFVTFRMKDIINELESIVDKVVEKYMAEKEYNEFIKLLKYFVEIQDSKIDIINILVWNDGSYEVLNEDGDNIMNEMVSDLTDTKYTCAVSIEDFIISGLITNAPKQVIIHCSENCSNMEFINTIKNVFTDRVKLCSECKYCEKIKSRLKV